MRQRDTGMRILTEAVRLFAKEGFEAVTVAEIAEAVGIKAPSLYKHYKSKQDIFDGILAEMERRDAENARNCEVPEDTKEADPQSYEGVSVDDLIGFCRQMFRYWTEDGFASSFRRMLTVEQYRDPRICALYGQYLGSGPLQYTADILGSEEAALTLYAPMHLLYAVWDGASDKQAVYEMLERHLEAWKQTYLEQSTVDN